MYGIKNYRSFVSNVGLSFAFKSPLRIAVISFTVVQKAEPIEEIMPAQKQKEIFDLLKIRNPEVNKTTFAIWWASSMPASYAH